VVAVVGAAAGNVAAEKRGALVGALNKFETGMLDLSALPPGALKREEDEKLKGMDMLIF